MAHDYNNILSVIMGFTDLAIEQVEPTDPMFDDLQEILKAAVRGAEVTRQLLAFSRQEIVAPMVLDLNATVEQMLKMLRRLIGEDIKLHWLPHSSLLPVKIDPSQIDQLLINLCINARDAITDVGNIWVTAKRRHFDQAYCNENPWAVQGDFVMLSVSDDGSGMDIDQLNTIFEPFYTTKETGKGTGLGLATVHGIIKQNDGFTHVSSEPGHGSRFEIYLPFHLSPMEDITATVTEDTLAGTGEIVLVVDDDRAIVKLAEKNSQEP